MIAITLALLISSPNVGCTKGLRGDPAVRIEDEESTHWIHFMPDDWSTCGGLALMFAQKQIDIVCGCKEMKTPKKRDRLLLKCALRMPSGRVVSKTTAIFYYSELVEECNRMRDTMMFGKKRRSK